MDDPHYADTVDDTPEARLGAELRRLRVQAGLSVRRLADELHRAHSGIVEYEGGRRLAPVDVVEQYEEYFGLSRGALGAQRERARVERLEWPRDGTVAEHLGEGPCPYKGLHAFECEDAALFFGREAQVDRVLERLAEVRFVAVVGASGSGKSSFVRAGLLARIRATDGAGTVRVVSLTPGEYPVEELARAVSAQIGQAVRADDLRTEPGRLERAAREAGGGGLVLVVDQLEELFTLCREEVDRRCFVDALMAAWRGPSSPAVVIVALRADFYGRVASYPELAAAVVAHQALIGPMAQSDLRRAIELPAVGSGLRLQLGLAQTMLEDLADEPGALPLLSHALLETWKRRRRLMLTVGGYREAGGVRGAIAKTAEDTLQTLPDADREIARFIFLSLTDVGEGVEPTRRRIDRGELAAPPQFAPSADRVLGVLADARLVTLDERTVVVSHEALIRHWPRLRGWIDAERAGLLIHRRLTDTAREWDTLDREPAALYRGARLAAASEWASDHTHYLSQLDSEFLTASHAAEEREIAVATRRARRLRILAAGLAALTTIVAALAVWAFGQRSDAQRERSAARVQTAQATSLALAASALPLADSRPDLSLLLAAEAFRASPRPEARTSVLTAIAAARDPGVLAILRGQPSSVYSVAFSRDGGTLASAGVDKAIRLWDTRTHKALGVPLTGHTDWVTSIAFSPDGHTMASASNDNTIRLWDVRTQKQLASLTGHGVNSVAFSSNGRTLASASVDNTIRLWDVRSRQPLGSPLTGKGHTDFLYNVAFSPDGHTLASASHNNAIRLWDARTHKPLGAPLSDHGTFSVAFSPDGRTLASGSADNTIRLWDVHTRKPLGARLTGHTAGVESVAFSHDGRLLASGSDDRTIRVWDVRTHKQLGAPLTGHANIVRSVAFGRGHTLASGSNDETIRLWDVGARRSLGASLTGHTNKVSSVAFSPDRRTLASGSWDKTVRLWDVGTHQLRGAPLKGHTGWVNSVAFSPDGRTLASASNDDTIRFWDVRTRHQLGAPLTNPDIGSIQSVAFSRDGRMLASGASAEGAENTIRLWDVRTHNQLGAPLSGHSLDVSSIAFSPDGHTLASGSQDGTIRLWDPRTHQHLGTLATASSGDPSGIYSVAFSPDGTLASASQDDTIRFWDVHSEKQRGAPLTRHTTSVRSVTFSHDGRTLAAAGLDGVTLWDVRTHKSIGTLGARNPADSVAFSPDGRTLAYAGPGKTIRIWKKILWQNFAQLQAEVCNLVGTGLTKAEWTQYASGIPYRQSCP